MENRSQILEELQEFVNQPFCDLKDIIPSNTFKNTILVLLSLTGRIDFIADSIIQLENEPNIYSMRILLRSLIEHHLRHTYIFMKWSRTKSEECANDYLTYYAYNEELELAASYKRQGKLTGCNSSGSIMEVFKELHPKMVSLTEAKIREKSSQFFYKRIIEFVGSEVYKTGYSSPNMFLPKIFPEYSEMSSFVHGGSFADLVMSKYANETKLVEESERIADLALSISATTKLITLIMLSNIDNKYSSITSQYQSLLLKYKIGGSGA
jgi:hypothetical protein